MDIGNYSYEDIEVGKIFQFKKTLSNEDVLEFSKITGDKNPLHIDEEYARMTPFKGKICHGMLVAGLFSTLFGMICPGKRNLYLSQTINFRKPVRIGTELIIKGKVEQKIDSLKVICVKTEIIANNDIMIDGDAKIRLMD